VTVPDPKAFSLELDRDDVVLLHTASLQCFLLCLGLSCYRHVPGIELWVFFQFCQFNMFFTYCFL
jgi:hypothetical protein